MRREIRVSPRNGFIHRKKMKTEKISKKNKNQIREWKIVSL